MIKKNFHEDDRRVSYRRYMIFNLLNGGSFTLLAENVLILYLLKNGVPEYMTAVVLSFLFLSMPFILMGKRLMRRFGAAGVISFGWFFRNLSGLLIAIPPFFSGYLSPFTIKLLIVLGSFLFFSFRSIGIIGFRPLGGELAGLKQSGRLAADQALSFNATKLITALILAFVTARWSGMSVYQIILLTGVGLGLSAAFVMTKIDESEAPRKGADISLKDAFSTLMRSDVLKKMVTAQSVCLSVMTLSVPVFMIALKKGFHVSESVAMRHILIQITGGITVAFFNRKLSDKKGPRFMLLMSVILLLFAEVMAAAAPAEVSEVYTMVLFFIVGVSKSGIIFTLLHYFLVVAEIRYRVGHGMILQAFSGVAAGLSGFFISGGLLKFLSGAGIAGFRLYKIYFVIMIVLTTVALFSVVRLNHVEEGT